MLDTTFVMVVGRDGSEWDCSCHVMDLIWHMANKDAKAEVTSASCCQGQAHWHAW